MSEYTEQADKFLADTGTEFKIEYLRTGPYFIGDAVYRDIYLFALSNADGTYSHEYRNSIRNTEARALCKKYGSRGLRTGGWSSPAELLEAKKYTAMIADKYFLPPSAYDVLADLSPYAELLFDEWCSEFGYSDWPLSDYPKIRALHDDCLRESAALARMFTPEQLEQLQEIN